MSWFDINAEDADYKNLIKVSGGLTSAPETWLNSSFSDIGGFWYVLLVIGFLGVLHWLLIVNAKLGDKLASYSRVAAVLGAVLFVYGSYLLFLLWNIPFAGIPDNIRNGVFGDSLGTLNALFSGMAFSGVLITLLFQRKDLSETRAQISNQQIESQFYNMLEQQQEVVRNFDLQSKATNEVIARGRDCFRDWCESLHNIYPHASVLNDTGGTQHDYTYDFLYDTARADLSLYFRSLYSLFRFIDSVDYKGETDFGVVVRSFLSDYELVLLFYNCNSARGKKFRRFAEKHALFDNLDPKLLLDSSHCLEMSVEAFGQNEDVLILFPGSPGDTSEVE